MNDDIRHLDLLAIFHYVVAALIAICGLFPIIHLTIGIAMVTGSLDGGKGQGPPPIFGYFFIGVALIVIFAFWAMAAAIFMAGNRLKRRFGYTFCLVVAAIECTFMPFGTVLGVFTIVVLMRPSVKAMFDMPSSSPASS